VDNAASCMGCLIRKGAVAAMRNTGGARTMVYDNDVRFVVASPVIDGCHRIAADCRFIDFLRSEHHTAVDYSETKTCSTVSSLQLAIRGLSSG
jgi:hypothetical protein